jgi:protein-disulfide isomerase
MSNKVTGGNAPVRGGKGPKVTIVALLRVPVSLLLAVKPTLDQVEKTYDNDVQIDFKHFPLSFPPQRLAPAAIAAEAAKDQGKFWEMHDKLFANQANLDRATFEKHAQELGLDMAKFKAALDGNKGKDQIEANMKEGAQFGVRGTPGFFINGRFFRGAQPVRQLQGGHRRGAEEGRREAEGRAWPGRACTRPSSRTAWTRPPRRPPRRPRPRAPASRPRGPPTRSTSATRR